jgi:hydroxymethylglutaryl-CoA synthase
MPSRGVGQSRPPDLTLESGSVAPPVRIASVGAAAPGLRVAAADVAAAWGSGGGRGQAAVCGADEDVLTLAWQAGRRALAAAGIDPADVDGLWWGTSRPPFAEGPGFALLAASLSLPSGLAGALCAGSAHAGIEALLSAWDAVAAGSVSTALVVAADALVPGLGTSWEPRVGAGAAAFVLCAGEEWPHGALQARHTATLPVLDRYRGDGEAATRDLYDPRLFREEVFLPLVTSVARAAADPDGDGVRAWSLPDPDGRLGGALAKKLGADASSSAAVYASIGDTGAAAPLLGIVEALATPGRAVAVGYGGGRCTAVTIDVDAPIPGAGPVPGAGRAVSYAEALRARGQLQPSGEGVAMGVPPGGAGFVRGNVELLGLHGARCVDCGTVSTPPSVHPTCTGCGGAKLEVVELARAGTVFTFIVNHTMPAPFVAPLPLVVIDLDDGARIQLQGLPEDAADLRIGDRVELELRRYAVERGVPVYGFKAKRVSTP